MSTNIYTQSISEFCAEFDPNFNAKTFWTEEIDPSCYEKTKNYNRKGKKHPMYGRKHSEESKQLMREASTGVSPTAETRKKLSDFNKGKTLSEEHKQKIRESHYGIKPSEETRKKMSEAKKGKKASEETKRKMREAHKRRNINTKK